MSSLGLYVQQEISPVRVVARSPVAWIAASRVTELLKSIDKVILWMMSKLLGRNESECTGGLVIEKLWKPSPQFGGEGSIGRLNWQRLLYSSGVIATAW